MKTVVITGASKGLGLEISKFLLTKNWRVYGLASGICKFKKKNFYYSQLDIRNAELVKKFFTKKSIKIDLLINNAGVFHFSEFLKTSIKKIDSILDTNIKGSVYVTKFSVPLMKRNSRMIFINSVAGLTKIKKQSIYCASKQALTAFAAVLGEELRKNKIKVTSIHPGGINTTLWKKFKLHKNKNKLINPVHIAKLIEFICKSPINLEYKNIKLFPEIEWH
jgi:NADP-dependent 3-hydroxy acid dehydrogenase YdfG